MRKHKFNPRDFDNPSLFFLVYDFLNNLLGGQFIYSPYYKTFELTGAECILDFGCGGGVGSRILAKYIGDGGSLADAFTIETATSGLDRKGICNMVRDCLRADTATLYGSGKLVQVISSDWTDFNNASADTVKAYKLFLSCPPKTTAEVRSQNADSEFEVQMRIEGYKIDPDTAASNIDDIDAQVALLINQQMYNGQMFTEYFTDTSAQVIDAEYISGDLTIDGDADRAVVECAALIIIRVNRWR